MHVLITANTERRLWALIRAIDTEIGGWGYARLDGDNIVWENVFLVPQQVSESEVDFESTGGDTAAVEQAIKDGVLDDPAFVWVSWHSHHSMKPFWSKTDDARIAAMAKTGVTRLLSFVGCHDGQYELRLDVFGVEAHGVRLGQVSMNELELTSEKDDEFTASIRDEIAANVKEKKALALGHNGRSGKSSDPAPALGTDADEDDRCLKVEEAFAVKDLMDHNFTYEEALRTIDVIGAEGVDELMESGLPFGPDEVVPVDEVVLVGGQD
jgi:hypothetical protein